MVIEKKNLADDPQRPIYHYVPPANWMNDPNGMIFYQGKYHLFYQYNPDGPLHGNIHWGHAISVDLIQWEDVPIALAPTPNSPDKDGIWSGYISLIDDKPVAFYTGVLPETQCMAFPMDDDLIRWEKYRGNPVIAAPPPNMDVTGFRDPNVWRDAGVYYMTVGSGIRNQGGMVLLYRSENGTDWTYMHPILKGKLDETGDMWECPVLFRLNGKDVLVVSRDVDVVYAFIGKYEQHHFEPEHLHVFDVGHGFYAPQVFRDGFGRNLMMGWIVERRNRDWLVESGWAGAQSIPVELSISAEGKLVSTPIQELEALRGNGISTTDQSISDDDPFIPRISGDALEIEAVFERESATSFGICVRCSPDREEFTDIIYDHERQQLIVKREKSSLDARAQHEEETGHLSLADDEKLTLRIFIDRSVLEVFANDVRLTTRIYPTRPDSTGLQLFARGGSVTLHALDIWQMRSIHHG